MPSSWYDAFTLNVLVLLLAVALDLLLPEPPAIVHPVVWMGKAISVFERVAPTGRVAGLFFGGVVVIVIVGISCGVAWLSMAALSAVGPAAYVVGGAVMLRISFTARGLVLAAEETRTALEGGHLDKARESLKSLVSRDAEGLSASLVAAAVIESVAENTTDSFVAPWLAFAVFGVPGAVAFRAINTLDSMLGIRGRYEYFGKTAARLDDAVNLIPARLSALLILVSGGLGRHSLARGWRTMMRDRHLTASPNAGWTMGAMAGLLGVRLEKPGHYCLGEGLREPDAEDIGKSMAMAKQTAALGVVAILIVLAARHAIFG